MLMILPPPASANPRAMPRPMPPLPPVTIATLPVRSNSAGFNVDVPDESSALALPDQDQAESGQRRAVSSPLDLVDHEARLRPADRTGALTDPEQPDGKRKKTNDQKQFGHGISSFAIWPARLFRNVARVARSLTCGKGRDDASELSNVITKAQKSPGRCRGF